MLWVLVAASIALRVIYYGQVNGTPFLHMERWAQTDMHYYDGWARQIAAGDWLSSSVPMPMHRWHHEVAQAYFAQHADVRAGLERESRDPDAAIWAQWMRSPRFYQDPLYPYLVAVLYRFTGSDVRGVLILQLAAGVLTTLLIWSLARSHFGDAAGAWAGVLAVLCAPLMFYELLLLRDSLIACAGVAIVWLADRALDQGRRRWFAATGAALGLAYLLKSSFLMLGAFVVVIALLALRRSRRSVLIPAVALCAGLAVALAPLVARNVLVGVPPLSLATSGPLTFVSANDADALPDVGFGIDVPRLTRFLGDTDGSWRAAVVSVAARHTARTYAAMLWRKWDRAWHWFEIPNNEDLYYFRLQAPVLAWMPVTFWIVAPLALVGLALAAARAQKPWTLFALVVSSVTTLVAFYVLGRFRVMLVAAALPFAGLTCAELAAALRQRRLGHVGGLAVAIVLLGLWTGRPLASDQQLIRTSDWILAWSVEYQDRVYGALDRKDPAVAGATYQEFFARYEPTAAQILASGDPRLAPELADMHAECAQILRAAGRVEAAALEADAARRLLALRPTQ
jgi:4-amino-4-deoxy-L-arabinose transferase-like glycosyltransferase